MKNGMKIAIRMLIGAIIGFTVAYAAIEGSWQMDLQPLAYPVTLVLVASSVVSVLLTVYYYLKIRKSAGIELHGEDEDLAEGRMYRQYSDATLTGNLGMILSLAALSLIVISGQSGWLALIAIAAMLVSVAMTFIMPGLMKKMYPERRFPSVSDKDYAEKLLAMSDDGEKHVMLGGLYKSFLSMNTLLFGAILLLLFYSVMSGTSQLAGIFIIAAIMIITNTQYLIHIRNK